jgi:hypothetical protein
MRPKLRTMILATSCLLAIGTSAAQAQTSPLFYYPAPGDYATTQGTVRIPAAGYYPNMPLAAVPTPGNPAPTQGSTYSSFYYPPARSFGYDATGPAREVPLDRSWMSPRTDSLGYKPEGPYWQLQRE